MSINLGDNFKYLGKKFLDDRESFATLEEMRRCSTVPDGFITYCKEDGKRYEFNSSNNINDITGQWVEFSVNGKGDDTSHYFGREIPEDLNVIWFDEGNIENSNEEIKFDNPIVEELFACINALQLQIIDLQKEVEYLKVSGGGNGNGGGNQDPEDPNEPNPPEDPNEPNPPEDPNEPERFSSLMMEDGSMFLLEDGGYITLEDQDSPPAPDPALILEDEGKFLLEDGGTILLEQENNQ